MRPFATSARSGADTSQPGSGDIAVAVLAGTALFVTTGWLATGQRPWSLSLPEFLALVLAPASVGRITLVRSSRTSWRPVGALVAVAAVCGGPMVGALAAVCAFATTVGGVWRFRVAWGSAGVLAAFSAGVIAQGAPWSRSVSAGVALAAVVPVQLAAFALVAWSRRIEQVRAEAWTFLQGDLVELVIAAPLVVGAAVLQDAHPAVVAAEVVAVVVALHLAEWLRLSLVRQLAEARLAARRDRLTNAPNRLALDEALAAEHARIRRGAQPAGVLFLDLDHFRDVNNRLGYAVADQLLVALYRRIREEVRVSDFICRWGGEEFVIIAPEIGGELSLTAYADKVRLLIKSRPLAAGGETVTASLGATLLDDRTKPEDAVRIAGECVKRAKATRDAVVIAPRVRRPGPRLSAAPSRAS
jgi:diguanylate cyclase (GGDEF)-like protein